MNKKKNLDQVYESDSEIDIYRPKKKVKLN